LLVGIAPVIASWSTLRKEAALREFARLAIGGRDCLAAGGAAGEATVDAIPVGIVGDDESALLGLRRNVATKHGHEGESGQQIPHDETRYCGTRSVTIGENERETVNDSLTASRPDDSPTDGIRAAADAPRRGWVANRGTFLRKYALDAPALVPHSPRDERS